MSLSSFQHALARSRRRGGLRPPRDNSFYERARGSREIKFMGSQLLFFFMGVPPKPPTDPADGISCAQAGDRVPG